MILLAHYERVTAFFEALDRHSINHYLLTTMNNYQLLALTSATIAGTLLNATSAHALSISLNNSSSGSGIFSYDITLNAGESLAAGDDYIYLKNLAGVTGTNAQSPYATDGSDSTSADFLVSTTIPSDTSPQTFLNAITIISNNPTGNITFEGTTDANSSEFLNNNIEGPVATNAVPFDFSPSLGILTIIGFVGLNFYRQRIKSIF